MVEHGAAAEFQFPKPDGSEAVVALLGEAGNGGKK